MRCSALPGPGATPSFPARFRGFNYDLSRISLLPGFDITPFATVYGGRVGLADMLGHAKWDLIAAAGPDPTADATVDCFEYTGVGLAPLPGSGLLPFASKYGVNVAAGAYGYY